MRVRIRWSQAALALLGMAAILLALRVAPSFLKPPAPPPLPEDVGLPRLASEAPAVKRRIKKKAPKPKPLHRRPIRRHPKPEPPKRRQRTKAPAPTPEPAPVAPSPNDGSMEFAPH